MHTLSEFDDYSMVLLELVLSIPVSSKYSDFDALPLFHASYRGSDLKHCPLSVTCRKIYPVGKDRDNETSMKMMYSVQSTSFSEN